MKNLLIFVFLVLFISCVKDPTAISSLKYSQKDLAPLNDSIKNVYHDDATYIHFRRAILDTNFRNNRVNLNENEISSYYNDLLKIYNNCYTVSNSFFENISAIHCQDATILYNFMADVDTSKVWSKNWFNGNPLTGIAGIDSLVERYNITIQSVYQANNRYSFHLKSGQAINYYALKKKLEATGEFYFVEPYLLIGLSRTIILLNENPRQYKYVLGWGDCPSGCIHSHVWEIQVNESNVALLKEYGDPL